MITAVVGLSSESIQVGTGVLVQMAWALFGLLIFLLQPIARLCHIEGHVVGAAAPWRHPDSQRGNMGRKTGKPAGGSMATIWSPRQRIRNLSK
ncbi:MAG TPA: hypothetical protein EYQ31_02885 [Candidatus Handelsmanbacteria bacterium]|nr:hypothetical protein [Candidatus Handelsmanbacteria bacterium]